MIGDTEKGHIADSSSLIFTTPNSFSVGSTDTMRVKNAQTVREGSSLFVMEGNMHYLSVPPDRVRMGELFPSSERMRR